MRKSCLLIILGVLLLGCSAPVHSSPPETSNEMSQLPPPAPPKQINMGQTMPISARAIVAGKAIKLEVARTPSEQAMGLMHRTSLADDRGMLFPFDPPQPVGFWMKNTLIPLDMVFLRNGVVKAIAADVPPCTSDPCPSYSSGVSIDQVIELRGGRAAELGLRVGDRVTVQKLDANKN